jgi:hypothetical protein
MLEKLNLSLTLLGLFERGERSEIAPAAGTRIDAQRIQSISSVRQSRDHART